MLLPGMIFKVSPLGLFCVFALFVFHAANLGNHFFIDTMYSRGGCNSFLLQNGFLCLTMLLTSCAHCLFAF
jgi:hypothetical protein